jgi:hypothetical protein
MFGINLAKNLLRPYYFRILAAVSWARVRLAPQDATQLEIGSGPTKREGWVTLDVCRGADVFWDLRHKLPFVDSCFDRVYCSHVLEHFSYPDLNLKTAVTRFHSHDLREIGASETARFGRWSA